VVTLHIWSHAPLPPRASHASGHGFGGGTVGGGCGNGGGGRGARWRFGGGGGRAHGSSLGGPTSQIS